MGLKYLPVSYKTTVRNTTFCTVLYLCLSSVNRFKELTGKHILPCMFYKQPIVIDCNNPSQKFFISKFDQRLRLSSVDYGNLFWGRHIKNFFSFFF